METPLKNPGYAPVIGVLVVFIVLVGKGFSFHFHAIAFVTSFDRVSIVLREGIIGLHITDPIILF